MKCDRGGVASGERVDIDTVTQFHPGHGEDGAGIGTGQRELVLFPVLQQPESHCDTAIASLMHQTLPSCYSVFHLVIA